MHPLAKQMRQIAVKLTTTLPNFPNQLGHQIVIQAVTPSVTTEIDFQPTGTPTSLNHQQMLKDCSNITTHELASHTTPSAEVLPLNALLAMDLDCGIQPLPMLLPLSHLHQQQSQMVPIQIQHTQPAIKSTAAAAGVGGGDPSGVDAQQAHIIPLAGPDSSNGGCLTCLPELPETEDFDGTGEILLETDGSFNASEVHAELPHHHLPIHLQHNTNNSTMGMCDGTN